MSDSRNNNNITTTPSAVLAQANQELANIDSDIRDIGPRNAAPDAQINQYEVCLVRLGNQENDVTRSIKAVDPDFQEPLLVFNQKHQALRTNVIKNLLVQAHEFISSLNAAMNTVSKADIPPEQKVAQLTTQHDQLEMMHDRIESFCSNASDKTYREYSDFRERYDQIDAFAFEAILDAERAGVGAREQRLLISQDAVQRMQQIDRYLQDKKQKVIACMNELNAPDVTPDQLMAIQNRLMALDNNQESADEAQTRADNYVFLQELAGRDPEINNNLHISERLTEFAENESILMDKIHEALTFIVDELTPPPPPPPPPDMLEGYHFFARNREEYRTRHHQIEHINLDARVQLAHRTALAAEGLTKVASSHELRGKIINSIENQLHEMKLYEGFIQDKLRLYDNPGAPDPTNNNRLREADFIDQHVRKNAARGDDVSARKIASWNARLDTVQQCIEQLNQAKANVELVLELGAERITYYNQYYDPDAGKKFDTLALATTAAKSFVQERSQTLRAGVTVWKATAGPSTNPQTTEKYEYRFYPTEITSKRRTLPAGIVQKTNTEQTFTEQTVHLSKSDINELSRLPTMLFSPEKRAEKLLEQFKFVSNLIEACLASIKDANGPLSLHGWSKQMLAIAAIYTEKMGYKLTSPRADSILNGVSQETKDEFSAAFDQAKATNPDFRSHIEKAEARRDLKSGALTSGPDVPRRHI